MQNRLDNKFIAFLGGEEKRNAEGTQAISGSNENPIPSSVVPIMLKNVKVTKEKMHSLSSMNDVCQVSVSTKKSQFIKATRADKSSRFRIKL